ncbi:MAG TPA: hypothetical protein VLA84_03560 [Microcoleus sp.]|nr:hypothetical protein [Microcoleus sp.]
MSVLSNFSNSNHDQSIYEGLARLEELNIPIVSDLPFGYEGVNAALPMGVMLSLDADSGWLSCG